MKLLFSLLLLAASLPTLGQFKNLSIHASVNIPSIGSVSTSNEPNYEVPSSAGFLAYRPESWTLEESFKTKPGFSFGSKIDFQLKNSFFLTSGLTISYARYQRTVEIKELSLQSVDQGSISDVIPGTPMGSFYGSLFTPDPGRIPYVPSNDIGKTNQLFAEIPIMIGRSFLNDKLRISIGAATSFLMYASYYRQNLYNSPSYSSTSPYYKVEKVSDREPFNKIAFSGMLETSYQIVSKVSLNVSAQKFFTPIYHKDYQYGGKAQISLFSFGVGYLLN
jgi:hypothetical protein